jgi:hypothetical protein
MAKTKVPDALAELGITQADIDHAMADDEVDGELNDLANEVRDYWRSIAPVGEAADGDENPGQYRDSIHVERHGDGFHVLSEDFKAYWIEFGTSHMPEYAPAQKTAEHFGGGAVQLGGVLASERIMNAQGEIRVAKARHQDLVEGGASHAKLLESQERISRLERKRSTAFSTERQKRYREKNADRISGRRKKRRG